MWMGFERVNSQSAPPLWRLVGVTFMEWMEAGLEELRRQQEVLDRWNVFPVADGDTGRNMVATLEGAVLAMRSAPGDGLDAVSARAADGALMAARGNSGVILSQILAGIAESCRDATVMNSQALKQALCQAAQRARRQVANPVEGTILTVADAVGLGALDDGDLAACLRSAVEGGEAALRDTTNQLPALRHTQMLDSGGLGYLAILRGWLNAAQGRQPERSLPSLSPAAPVPSFAFSKVIANYYDVEALLYRFRCDNPASVLGERLPALGDSIVVAPGLETVKVHVHTDKPVELMRLLTEVGDVREMEWLDMRHQVAQRHLQAGLRIVVHRDFRPLFESTHVVIDPSEASDQPDTLWVNPVGTLMQAVGTNSLGLAGQAALEYVVGDSWEVNRERLMRHLLTMRNWKIGRQDDTFVLDGQIYRTRDAVKESLSSEMEDFGVVTVYLSQSARREEAVFWQDAFNAELVQVPRQDPWMEMVWQP